MAAKVTKEFPGRPDHESAVRQIKVGEIIHGELAAVAVAQKWAEEVKEAKAAAPAAEPKPGPRRHK